MSEIGERVGRVIRARRKKLGLSQGAIASLAGVNRSYLGEIERGEVDASAAKLESVAAALGLRLSELVRLYEENRNA